MSDRVLKGSVHQHYKNGHHYRVVDIPVNPNTEEMFVVYRELSAPVGGRAYVRPLDEFRERFMEIDSGRDTSAPKSFS